MMNHYTHILRFALASSFVVSSVYAAPWSGVPMPQATTQTAAQGNAVAAADPQAQVTSEANTTNATDNQVAVRSVQTSAPLYASKPPFDALDTNHDGIISESEAAAYPPLANDYLHVAEKGSRGVTRAEYERW
jgi:hypothetical protein